MVWTARQLESKYSGNGGGYLWGYGHGMEHQCGEGGQAKNAREGEIFPESVVRTSFSLQMDCK